MSLSFCSKFVAVQNIINIPSSESRREPLKMELDTGRAVSIIPHDLYKEKFNDKLLHKTELMLKTYTGENIVPLGVLKANVKYKDQQRLLLDLYVVKNKDPELMGRDWLYNISLDWLVCY